MDLSSSAAAATNGGTIAVSPVPYNTTTGAVTVSSNTFPIAGMTPVGIVTHTNAGSMTAGSAVLTDPAGSFKSTDVGRSINITGAGAAGANLVANVKTFTSATSVTLATAATTTVSNATYTLADSSQALCDTINSNFGTPAAANASAVQLAFTSSTVFTPGAAVANGDSGTTGFQTPLTVAAPGVLSNDTGPGITVTGHTSPSHGSVSIAADGSYTYTPADGYSGPDSFTYTITDSFSRTATATVSLTVGPPGAPVATDDSYTTPYQTSLVTPAPGVLSNDTGATLTVTGHTDPSHGTLTQNANGSFTYTPANGYAGPDSYTYTVTDSASQTATATVNLTVSPPAAPTAADDSYGTAFNTALVTAAPGVLTNDSGTALSVTGHTDPSHGTVSIGADGSFTYTPASNYSGADSFGYTVTDGFARSSSATVNLTVAAPGAPTAADDTYSTPFQTDLVTAAPGVLGNDSGTAITVTGHTAPSHGTVSIAADGSFTYSPAAGFSGPDSFGYTVTDSAAQTASATVNITVGEPAVVPGISGTVTDATSSAKLAGITVTLMQANPAWVVQATAVTDAQGHFGFTGLPNGSYQVRYFDGTGAHARTWYNGKTTYKTADVLTIASSSDVVDASQALAAAPSGVISGRAQTSAAVGIPGIQVSLYTKSNGYYAGAITGANGYYQFNGVPAGDYYIQFVDPSHKYRSQWYNFKLLFFNADVVTVGSGVTWANALMG
jgi:hypothetical protein